MAILTTPTAKSQKPQLLFAALPTPGHIYKVLAIASLVSRRGYRASFLTGTTFREEVEAVPGLRFVPLAGKANYDGARPEELFPEMRTQAPGPERLAFGLKNAFLDPIPDQHATLQSFLAAHADDGPVVVIHEVGFLGLAPILHGAPGLRPAGVISLGICPIFASSVDTPPFGPGLPFDPSEGGRARNLAVKEGMQEGLRPLQEYWESLLASLGASPGKDFFMDSWSKKADRYLQLSVRDLEYPRSDEPSNLRFIGPVPPIADKTHPLPSWWEDVVVNHKKPLVVVSQGTVATAFEDLILPTIEGLKDSDVQVVATLVRADDIPGYEVPSNAKLARYLPFDDLFRHADVIVSNGGYGAIQHSLNHGVPMVLAGLTEDKAEGNMRMAWAGAAINLAVQRPEPDQVREAVKKVLYTSEIKARVKELQKKCLETDCIGGIETAIEEITGRGTSA
ncbi:MAG: hypothetical protein M1832_005203 [Thelocarpon impressellum]|nr:MAG: hypothetical protein M1832_005203 [Thelocarpon impressellum]